MFVSTNIARSQILRSSLPRSVRLLHQNRTQSTISDQKPYWDRIPQWKDVSNEDFVSYRWQSRNTIQDKHKLYQFLKETLPDRLGDTKNPLLKKIRTRENFIEDAIAAIKLAPMAIRLTPHVLSLVDWNNPLDDPIRRQFLPLKSGFIPDPEYLELDSLHEEEDSVVPGLVHRYPGRALFLATSICPVYCRFCTRSYAVGASTDTVSKKPQKPSRKRWEVVFEHIANDDTLKDIVISGGDAYFLNPEHIVEIGKRLLNIPHIERIRYASKGLAVAPGRIIDATDPWTDALIEVSNMGRDMGKQVCLHTHINHAREITWVTELAAKKLFKHGVIVRNQSVLLKGVNDSTSALLELVTKLANNNIQPYYIYQCDQVMGVEDLRTPLSDIITFDKELRGQLSGFMMPSFVIDLPGGGGKRLVSTHEKYENGVATYKSPGLKGLKGSMDYFYHDPKPIQETVLEKFRQDQLQALQRGETLQQFFAQSAPTINPTASRHHEPSPHVTTPHVLDNEVWEPSYAHA